MGTLALTDPVNGTVADASLIANNNAATKTVVNGGLSTVNLGSGHAQFVETASASSATVSITTEASSTTLLTFANTLFDATPVEVSFYCPSVTVPAAGQITVSLFEGGTQIGRIGVKANVTTTAAASEMLCKHYFTPTAATHTYSVAAFESVGTGTPSFQCGAGGTAALVPMFARIAKV